MALFFVPEQLVTSHLHVLGVLCPRSGPVLSPPLLAPDGGDITPTPRDDVGDGGGGGQGVPEAAGFPGARVGMGMGALGTPSSLLGTFLSSFYITLPTQLAASIP